MQINDQTQAVLLLTAWLGKPDAGQPQPLTTGEWARFAAWLRDQERTPADLLTNGHALKGWEDPKLPGERIRRLLERSAALAISVERWQRAGLWILSRSDTGYPSRLKKRLRANSPPILYGVGSIDLLEAGGVAIIGARDAGDENLSFTSRLGAEVAAQAGNVVSGGARGVDETAMLGALQVDGTAVGVLAENLLRASSSGRWRRYLADGNLALISPFNPEARFTPANAMARNKHVYCLADTAVVVASAAGKGGTWAGATETLRHGWVPVWVRPSKTHAGNRELIRKGAAELPPLELLDLRTLTSTLGGTPQPTGSLFDAPAAVQEDRPVQDYPAVEPAPEEAEADLPAPPDAAVLDSAADVSAPPAESLDLYSLFLARLRAETQADALTVADLQERLKLTKAQLAEWLKRAVEEGQAEKLARPVRYQAASQRQIPLEL